MSFEYIAAYVVQCVIDQVDQKEQKEKQKKPNVVSHTEVGEQTKKYAEKERERE